MQYDPCFAQRLDQCQTAAEPMAFARTQEDIAGSGCTGDPDRARNAFEHPARGAVDPQGTIVLQQNRIHGCLPFAAFCQSAASVVMRRKMLQLQ